MYNVHINKRYISSVCYEKVSFLQCMSVSQIRHLFDKQSTSRADQKYHSSAILSRPLEEIYHGPR